MQNKKISDDRVPPLLPKLHEIEESLLSNFMIGRVSEAPNYKKWVETIMYILNNARQYYLLGYIRKAYRAYLRAFCIRQELLKRIENDY